MVTKLSKNSIIGNPLYYPDTNALGDINGILFKSVEIGKYIGVNYINSGENYKIIVGTGFLYLDTIFKKVNLTDLIEENYIDKISYDDYLNFFGLEKLTHTLCDSLKNKNIYRVTELADQRIVLK